MKMKGIMPHTIYLGWSGSSSYTYISIPFELKAVTSAKDWFVLGGGMLNNK